ncbi:hypothetical protein XarbCFBP6827_05430 [Xanthomonas arboricola]|nr:hypothetical protein XarbCFBP6827_05430 [Xanthomonas arboricola]
MPRRSLHGRTCGVSREGGRARALQPSSRSAALQRRPRLSVPDRHYVVFSHSKSKICCVPGANTPLHRVPAFNHSRNRRLSNGQPSSRPCASRSTGTRSP